MKRLLAVPLLAVAVLVAVSNPVAATPPNTIFDRIINQDNDPCEWDFRYGENANGNVFAQIRLVHQAAVGTHLCKSQYIEVAFVRPDDSLGNKGVWIDNYAAVNTWHSVTGSVPQNTAIGLKAIYSWHGGPDHICSIVHEMVASAFDGFAEGKVTVGYDTC